MNIKRSVLLLASLFCAGNIFAQTNDASLVSTNEAAPVNAAVIPTLRPSTNNSWEKRHEGFVKIAQQGNIDILFMGDSITDFWRNRGSNVWNKCYAPRNAADFGISGDRTEHVLWRIDNGELDGIHPKVVVLMIGTNNTGKEKNGKPRNTVPQVVAGVQAVVKDIRTRLPDSKLLLLGIFPRGNFDDLQRAQVALVNTVIARLDDGKMIRYLDIGPSFLADDGTLSRDIMPDLLHPNERGYQIWADAMEPTLSDMLK